MGKMKIQLAHELGWFLCGIVGQETRVTHVYLKQNEIPYHEHILKFNGSEIIKVLINRTET